MNRIIVLLIFLLSFGCTTDNHQNDNFNKAEIKKEPKGVDDSFDISFLIEKEQSDLYSLSVIFELDSGCWVVSPYSNDSVYGPTTISISDNDYLIVYDTLIEIPASVEEFDSILNMPVRFIRKKTTYKQSIRVLTKDDFEVPGSVWFVLEPHCTPKKVDFVISYRSGKMEVRKIYTRGESNDHLDPPGSYKAMTILNAIRAYPAKDIPNDAYSRAYEYSRSLQVSSSRDIIPWKSIGPKNIGGRTLDLSLNQQNPNTIYAASAGGGLWRSYTGGVGQDAWERLELGYPAMSIGAVEICPTDTNVIFAGTGECYGNGTYFPSVSYRATRGMSGIGLLRSLDNGQTWEKSIDWSYQQQRGIQRIKFDPDSNNIVWVATTEGVYKSNNKGDTWDRVLNFPMATDISINPDDPDIVIVCCGGMFSNGNGIYRTTNGGQTWTKLFMGSSVPSQFGGKARVMTALSSPNIVYASIGHSQSYGTSDTWLCKSIDYGATWVVMNNTDYSKYQGWYSHYVGVSPFNPNKLFCGGVDMYQSSDGGNTLDIKDGNIQDWHHPDWLHLDHHDIEFHPTDPDIIYFAEDGGIHRTDDGGETFFSCNWGYQTSQFYSGFSCSDTDSLFATGGLQDNFSCIYEGDEYWRRVHGGDGSWTAINQVNNNNVFNSSQYLNISRSYDYGFNYENVAPDNSSSNANFIAPYLLSPVDNQTMYAGRSIIYKSTDSGTNWTATNQASQFDSNPVLTMDMSSTSTEVVYAATMAWNSRARIYKTIIGGAYWQDITADLPDRMITDIHVDKNNHNTLFITLGGFGTSHLYRSDDGGDNWTDIGSSLPDIPGWCVINDPLNTDIIYYGNEFGVYVSENNGQNWTQVNEGLGDGVFAMDLKISASNRRLRVATHGNGVYERPVESSIGIDENNSKYSNSLGFSNYPNPFSDRTTLHFELANKAWVRISVYDLSGKIVERLADKEFPAGIHEIDWNVNSPSRLKNGVYICRLSSGDITSTLKMHIVK